jgi:hypothetical protein
MARFIGTKKEFNRYIGPILRNIVQQVTRSYRNEKGSCQHCGIKENLEAAHIRGKERKLIIEKLLYDYKTDNIYNVDLEDFENKFRKEHEIVKDIVIILCKDCHTKYDSKQKNGITNEQEKMDSKKINNNSRIYTNTEIQIKVSNALKNFNHLELDKLCDTDLSNEIFNLNFSLLIKLRKDFSKEKIEELIKRNGLNRWTLKYPIEKNDSIYAITTQWYPRNDEFVKRWLNENVR